MVFLINMDGFCDIFRTNFDQYRNFPLFGSNIGPSQADEREPFGPLAESH